jgi:putative glycerol-1-phosphate prenyltransferase
MGMHLTYLEAGSGASQTVPEEMISYIREAIDTPLIVGGGITSTEKMEMIYDAGADIIVVGNAFESDLHKMVDFVKSVEVYNNRHNSGIENSVPIHPDIISM